MKAVEIEFVQRRALRGRALLVAVALALGGTLALGAYTGWMQWKLEAERRATVPLRADPVASPASPEAEVRSMPPLGAGEIADWSALDYGAVFGSIEAARVPGVRVTALEVNSAEAIARLEIEIRGQEDVLRFLSEINAGLPESERWTLVRSQAAVGEAGSPGLATLKARLPKLRH